MGRRVPPVLWITLALVLLLVVARLTIADTGGDSKATESAEVAEEESIADEEDEWEDFEEDDEVSLAAASSKARGRAVKALPQLNDQNADRILNSTEYVLLLGYASWCKHSAKVMIDFAEASEVLSGKRSRATLAKMDAIANPVTASRFQIKGYPTIVFITNGSAELYTAGQTRDDFVIWVEKKIGRLATSFSTESEAREHQNRGTTVVIGLFEKFEGKEYEEFLAVSNSTVDVEFLQTTNAEAAAVFNADFGIVTPTIAIWKSEPEKFLRYGGPLDRADLGTFVSLNKHALISKLHSRNAAKLYASPVKKQVLLFANSYDFDSMYPLYMAAARFFKGELFLVWVDIEDEEFSKPMTTMYGILGSEPAVAGFDNTNGSRYLMEGEITRASLKAFLTHYKEGRLKVHHKSEPIPKKNKGDVKIIVGKTFEKLVLSNPKDVLLMVNTQHCRNCETMTKVFVKLAKHFKGASSIVFAKIDASNNDHPQLQILQNYPAFLLYRGGIQDSPPVSAPVNANYKALVRFVEENHAGLVSAEKEGAPAGEVKSPANDMAPPLTSVESEVEKSQDLQSVSDAAIGKDDPSGSAFKDDSGVEARDIGGKDATVATLEFPVLTDTEDENLETLHEGVADESVPTEVIQQSDVKEDQTVTSLETPQATTGSGSDGLSAAEASEKLQHSSQEEGLQVSVESLETLPTVSGEGGEISKVPGVSSELESNLQQPSLVNGKEQLQDLQSSEYVKGHDEL